MRRVPPPRWSHKQAVWLTLCIRAPSSYPAPGVDFWSEVGPRTEKVDIMVEPHQVTRVANYLSNNGIDFEVSTPTIHDTPLGDDQRSAG